MFQIGRGGWGASSFNDEFLWVRWFPWFTEVSWRHGYVLKLLLYAVRGRPHMINIRWKGSGGEGKEAVEAMQEQNALPRLAISLKQKCRR